MASRLASLDYLLANVHKEIGRTLVYRGEDNGSIDDCRAAIGEGTIGLNFGATDKGMRFTLNNDLAAWYICMVSLEGNKRIKSYFLDEAVGYLNEAEKHVIVEDEANKDNESIEKMNKQRQIVQRNKAAIHLMRGEIVMEQSVSDGEEELFMALNHAYPSLNPI